MISRCRRRWGARVGIGGKSFQRLAVSVGGAMEGVFEDV